MRQINLLGKLLHFPAFLKGMWFMKQFSTPTKEEQTQSTKGALVNLSKTFDSTKCKVTKVPAEITSSWGDSHLGRDHFAIVIDNVLTQEECNQWIAATEKVGYEEALVNIGGGIQRKMTDVRNSSRCIIDDEVIASELWKRIESFVPDLYSKVEASELNERLRFLRYDPGEYFAPHCDGRYDRPDDHPKYGDRSYVTFQLYLNEGFEGGSTRFFHRSNDSFFDVVPKTGSVLLFEHRMLHSGEKLIKGRKYAVRTDIMYSYKKNA